MTVFIQNSTAGKAIVIQLRLEMVWGQELGRRLATKWPQ